VINAPTIKRIRPCRSSDACWLVRPVTLLLAARLIKPILSGFTGLIRVTSGRSRGVLPAPASPARPGPARPWGRIPRTAGLTCAVWRREDTIPGSVGVRAAAV
jgi:hypothetical protein